MVPFNISNDDAVTLYWKVSVEDDADAASLLPPAWLMLSMLISSASLPNAYAAALRQLVRKLGRVTTAVMSAASLSCNEKDCNMLTLNVEGLTVAVIVVSVSPDVPVEMVVFAVSSSSLPLPVVGDCGFVGDCGCVPITVVLISSADVLVVVTVMVVTAVSSSLLLPTDVSSSLLLPTVVSVIVVVVILVVVAVRVDVLVVEVVSPAETFVKDPDDCVFVYCSPSRSLGAAAESPPCGTKKRELVPLTVRRIETSLTVTRYFPLFASRVPTKSMRFNCAVPC